MSPRWLLPFTYGVDMRAIDYLVSLAENNGATLIPVSLISVPNHSRSGGARLEHIQQSKDFLEASNTNLPGFRYLLNAMKSLRAM
jgi:hypothetical protein